MRSQISQQEFRIAEIYSYITQSDEEGNGSVLGKSANRGLKQSAARTPNALGQS